MQYSVKYALLHLAARYGYKDVVVALLEKGANINKKGVDGWTPLHFAARYGHKEVVTALLEKKASVNNKNPSGWSPLHLAAYHGDKEVVAALLEKKANVNEENVDGWTPLHFAARYGHKEVVTALLEKKASVNNKNSSGWTPLHLAAYHGDKEVVEALLEEKANVHEKDSRTWTPLDFASKCGHEDVVIALLEKSACDRKVNYPVSLFIIASCLKERSNLELAKLLIRYTLIANLNKSIPAALLDYLETDLLSAGTGIGAYRAYEWSYYSYKRIIPIQLFLVKIRVIRQELLSYWDDCKIELNKMKEEDSDLYNFLTTQNINEQVRILIESETVQNILRDRLTVEYPIYSENLTNEIETAIFFSNNKKIINFLSKHYDIEIKTIDLVKSLFNRFMREHLDFEVEIVPPQLDFNTRELHPLTLKTLSFVQMINDHARLLSEEVVNNSDDLGKDEFSKKYICGVGSILGLSIAYLAGTTTLTPIAAIVVFIAAAAIGAFIGYGIGRFCDKVIEGKQNDPDMSTLGSIKSLLSDTSATNYNMYYMYNPDMSHL